MFLWEIPEINEHFNSQMARILVKMCELIHLIKKLVFYVENKYYKLQLAFQVIVLVLFSL